MPNTNGQTCRIGAISRVDFPSEGFRAGLLRRAAEIFRKEDVQYVILAGGLVDNRYVKTKTKKLQKMIKTLVKDRALILAGGERAQLIYELTKLNNRVLSLTKKMAPKEENEEEGRDENVELAKTLRVLKEHLKRIQEQAATPDDEKTRMAAEIDARIDRYTAYLNELRPEVMAEQLNQLFPVFRNAKSEIIRTYIVPGKNLDGDLGEDVAKRLHELRKTGTDDIRVYRSGSDRIDAKQANKAVVVVVPQRTKIPGKYYSTAVEGLLEEFARQTKRPLPDLFIVGGNGSLIYKPKGENKPFVSVPTLRCLSQDDLRPYENQTGTLVIELTRDQVNPVVRSYPCRDLFSSEERFINVPGKLEPKRKVIIDTLKEKGRALTAGEIEDETGLARTTIVKELTALTNEKGKRPKDWPGLRHFKQAGKWGLDSYWMREKLDYPWFNDQRLTETLVTLGCLHAGSVHVDYPFVLKYMPQIILERGAKYLVAAGDLIEGTKYGSEVYGNLNNTDMEMLAGEILARVALDVFRVRMEKSLLDSKGREPDQEELLRCIDAALITVLIIPGNHDLWQAATGHTPLVLLKKVMVERMYEGVAAFLAARGLCLMCLTTSRNFIKGKVPEPVKLHQFSLPGEIAKRKSIELETGEFLLPSGLRLAVMHPHMGRTKTSSIRLQEMLGFASGCHLVIGANFHVSEQLEIWDGTLGQRVCIEIGTAKRNSDFENTKMKIVDHGFGALTVDSALGFGSERRIIFSDCSFITAPPTRNSKLDRRKVYNDLVAALGLGG